LSHEKDKANKRILRSLSFDNNGLVKPSCGTIALYDPFGFFLRYGGKVFYNRRYFLNFRRYLKN
jgi:hypothetical protein